MKTSRTMKRILLMLMCLIMVFSIAACSERKPDGSLDVGPIAGKEKPKTTDVVELIKDKDGKSEIAQTIRNKDYVQKKSGSEWIHIDIDLHYYHKNYLADPIKITDYSIIVKGNINITDNYQSQFFLEAREVQTGKLDFGMYSYEEVTYLVVGEEKFYLNEINITEFVLTLVEAVGGAGIDPSTLVSGAISGNTGIELVDGILGGLGFLLWESQFTKTITDEGQTQIISAPIKLNSLLNLVKGGSLPIIGEISWAAFGLPDVDRLLDQILGFGLHTIFEKKWPIMDATLSAIATKMPVLKTTEYEDAFVSNGFEINIETPIVIDQKKPANSQLQKEYDLNIKVSPFRIGASGDMVAIDFSRTPLGSDSHGTVYKKGSLLNFETNISFTVENDNDTIITLNDILGEDLIDLGTVGLIPLKMPSATVYDFNLDVKINFDFFDNSANKGEFLLTFQNEQFVRGYLEGDVLYLDMSALTDKYGRIIPDIKLSEIDITGTLFNSEGLLALLDPTVTRSVVDLLSTPQNAEGEEEAGGLDIMALLEIILREDVLYLPGHKSGGNFVLTLETDTLNEIMGMILPGANLGLKGVTVEGGTASIAELINKLDVGLELSDNFRANVKINKFGFMREPVFDFRAIDSEAKKDTFIDVKDVTEFSLFIKGDFTLGLAPTLEDGIVIGLDSVIAGLTKKLLINVGIEIDEQLKLEYEINANVDAKDLGRTELTFIVYIPEGQSGLREKILHIYYTGQDDTIYIDLSCLHELDSEIPMLTILGELPKFYVKDVGLSAMLSGLFAGDAEVEDNVERILQNLAKTGISFEEEQGEGTDPLAVIGSIIGDILIDNYQVNILFAPNALTAIMALLGAEIEMPEINGRATLSIYKVQDGYVDLHFGILDTSHNEAVSIDFCIIRQISLQIGKRDIASDFIVTEFISLDDLLEDLQIAISLEGMFAIDTSADYYTNDLLDSLLSSLIEDLALKLDLQDFKMYIGYTIRGNININDIMASELEIILYDCPAKQLDKSAPRLLSIYLKNRNLYLDLSYFGLPKLGITNIESLAEGLLNVNNMSPVSGSFADILVQNQQAEDAIKIQLLINPSGLYADISGEIIGALLGALGLDLPIEFNYAELGLNTSTDIGLHLGVGIEGFDISLDAGSIFVSIDSSDRHAIIIDREYEYNMTELGLPMGVYLEVQGSLYFTNSEASTVDLSPLLAQFLDSVELNLFLELLGVEDNEVFYSIQAYLNLFDMEESKVNFSLKTATGGNILNVFYQSGDLYIDTNFLDIGKVKLSDVGNIFNSSTPEEEYDTDFLNEEQVRSAKTFLDLVFYDDGIAIRVTKDIIISVLLMLGLDLNGMFDEFEFEFGAVFTAQPINGKLYLEFATANLGLTLDKIDIKWEDGERLVMPPSDIADYEVITELVKIGIELTGELDLNVYGNGSGVRMDKILGAIGMLSDIGILFQVLGDRFGGTVYYKIVANLDLSNISALQLVIYLSSDMSQDAQGDILSLHVMGQSDGTIDIFLDASSLGLEKLWIQDVSGLIGSFTNLGPSEDPLTTEGIINNAESGSSALLPNIILGISTNREMQDSLLAVKVTTGAIYALLYTLAGVDLENLFEGFPPELDLGLIGDDHLLELALRFTDLMELSLTIHSPSLYLADESRPIISVDREGYTEINEETFSTFKVFFGGEINLTASQTNSNTEIDFSDIIMHFLETTDFGVILQNLERLDSTIYYNVEVAINIRKAIAGDLVGAFKLKFTITDSSGNLLIAAYLDEGTFYIDLERLGISKVKIEDAFDLLGVVSNSGELLEEIALLNDEQNPSESLANAYVLLQLSNEDGAYVQIAQDVIRIMLNSFGLPGEIIVSSLHNKVESIITAGSGGLAISLVLAEYEAQVIFNKLGIGFKDNDVVIDINKDEYANLSELPSEVYVNFSFTFELGMSQGAEYDFTNLLTTLMTGGSLGFDIQPILYVLEQISTKYYLDVEALIKINDILSSDIKLELYAHDVDIPVLRLYYIDGTIYIDAEAFNIQKLKIVDGINFFQSLFVTGNPVPLGNVAPVSNNEQAERLASLINVSLSKEGLVAHVGASALFAVLGVLGGIPADAEELVTSIGDLHFELMLFGTDALATIKVQLWSTDAGGEPVVGHGIFFGIELDYDFAINLKYGADHLSLPIDWESFHTIDELAPIISLATTIEIDLSANIAELPDIYGEPLSGLINTLISDLIFQISLKVVDRQEAIIVLDIKANLNPLDISSLELQVEIKNKADNNLYARINIMSGNLYIDLSKMGGSKMKVPNVLDTILPSNNTIENGILNEEGNTEIELPVLSILAQIQRDGLFIFAEKQVFDILFSLIGLNEFTMMSNIHAVVSLVPNTDIKSLVIGAEIGLGDSSESDVFSLGIAINGVRVNFVRYGYDQIIKVNSTEFVDIADINMIKLQTVLEFSLATEQGGFDFRNLLGQLFESEEIFGRALAPQLEIAEQLGDTIVMELKLLIPLEDIIEGLQVRAHIYSKNSPSFDLELMLWNGNLYLDGVNIGLSKIYGKNIPSLIAGFLVKGEEEGSEPVNAEVYYQAWQGLLNSSDPNESGIAKLSFILSGAEGLTLLVSTEMLLTALGLVGVDIAPYIDGLIEPSVDVNVSPALNFRIGINLPSSSSQGSIGLGLTLIGQSTSFDTLYEVIVETISGPRTNVPPLISAQERAEYTDYSDLELYLAFSAIVELELEEGRLDFSQLLHILADGLNVGLDVREAHKLRLAIDIELGIAINKLISRDEIARDESVRLKGKVHYTIISNDGSEYHSQTVLSIFNYGQELYVSLEVFGTTIKLRIPDFSVGGLINEMIDLSPFADKYEEDGGDINNAQYLLYNDEGISNDLLLDLVLDKQGIYVLITAELIGALERLISSEELDMSGAIKSIIDGGHAGVFVDNGLYIGINLQKEGSSAENRAGYNLDIRLLDGLTFDTNGKGEQKKYYHFYNQFQQDIESGMFNDYILANEIRDRVTLGLRVEITADMVATMLDWSDLFDVQEIPTKFILEFLSDMHGTLILDILVDIDINGLDQLGLEGQVLIKNTDGELLFGLYYVGSINSRQEGYADVALYFECEPLGIPKLKISGSTLENFMGIDISKLFGFRGFDDLEEGGVQNAEGDEPSGTVDFTKLFDSISIARGTIGIVVAQNIVASILSDLFGFNFADIGAFELALDMIDDNVVLDLALDSDRKLDFKIGLSDFYIHLGINDIFKNKDFSAFREINDYQLETVVESSLNITDKLFSVFDMKAMTAPLLNDLGVLIQAGDNLDIQLDFALKVFINFADLRLLKFELEVKLFDKVMARITYVGELDNGTIYVQLEGLSLPNMQLDNINLGGLVRDLLSNIGEEEDGEIVQNSNQVPLLFAEELDDLSALQSLLHFILDYEDVTIAITGALAVSLLGSVTDGMVFPEFDRAKIGYSKKDNLQGLLLILTQNGTSLEESFRIKYNFNDMRFNLATNVISTIDHRVDSTGKQIIYKDISVINKIGLTLDAEVVLKTRKPTDGKSEAITGLENLVAGLLKVPPGAIDLDLQNSYLIYGISLGLIVDLADMSKTKLSLDVTYNMRPLLSVYYIGETNTVYADLSGMGLFKASISGMDLMSLVGDLLSGFELIQPGEGLNVGGALEGLFNAEGASIKRLPTIKIVLDNRSISILPNIESIAALVPAAAGLLPPINHIAAGMNFYAGLNNASVQVKLDTKGNEVFVNVPQGGLRFAIGDDADDCSYVPSDSALMKFGGIAGINLNANGMNMDTMGLVNSIYDSINLKRFTVYLEKRNHYWQQYSFSDAFKTNQDYGVRVDPNSTSGFSDWGNFSDYTDYYISPIDIPTGVNGYNRTKLVINRMSNNALEVNFWQIDNKAARSGVLITNSALNLRLGTGLIYMLDVSKVFDLLPPPWNLIKHIVKPKIPIPVGEIVDRLGVLPPVMDLVLDELLGGDEDTTLTAVYGNAFGYVVDDITGEPVQGAKVSARLGNDTEHITYTNKDGAYAFLDLKVGNGYNLRITCPEQFYVENTTTFNIRNVETYDTTVIATRRLTRQDTAVYDNVRFHGRVTIGASTPAAGVGIFVSTKEKTEFVQIGTTDADGYYDLYAYGLIGSKHHVMIGADSGTLFDLGEAKYYVITQTAERVDGFNVSRNYTLVLYDLYTNITFTGIVTDYFGALIPDAIVRVRDDVKGSSIIVYTDENGRYTIKQEAIEGLYHSVRAEIGGYHTMSYTKKTVNANNQTITQNLIAHAIRDVEYKGTIRDDFGNPIQGANILINNTVVAQTNILGQYSFVQFADGLSKKIRAEKPGFFQSEDTSKSIDGGTFEVVTDLTLYSIKDIVFSGVVRDGNNDLLKQAQIYHNNVLVTSTNDYGEYSFTYTMPSGTIKEKDFKIEHTLRAGKDGYFEIDNVKITTYKETSAIERNFVLSIVDSGSIVGKLIDNEGKPVTDVDIYFTINGKTAIKPETKGLEPVNIAIENYMTEKSQIGIDAGGNINIKGLPLNVDIVIKFRSRGYENKNHPSTIRLTHVSAENQYDLGTIVLNKLPPHWSQLESDINMGMIAKVRIRLGADIRDAAYHNNDFSGGGFQLEQDWNVRNRLNHGIEAGSADNYDDISYIELWLDPMFLNDLFNTIHNLMMEMMSIMPINKDSVIMPHDLIRSSDVQFSDNGVAIGQTYNENDMTLYNYKYSSYTQYLAAYKNGVNKIPSGIIGWGIGTAVESMAGWIKTAIGLIPSLVGDIIRQASAILAHMVPFQDAYSMIQTQGVSGNPLNSYSDMLEQGDANGLVNIGSANSPIWVKRQVDYFDLGAYVKVSMDTSDPYQNTIQRISILLNGATYANQGDNSNLNGNGNFAPKATSVQKRDIVVNGVVNTTNQAYMQNWIKYNVVNSYIVINEYNNNEEQTLRNQYFIFDNYGHQVYDSGNSIKDDAFQEIDIDNNGLGLRVARALPDSFFQFSSEKGEVDYNPPSEIIFNDPYDPSDFTFIGGTWAYDPANNNTRTNTDPEKTPLDFLPNRVNVAFLDGNSSGNNGVGVSWDMSAITFDPHGTDPNDPKDVYFLKGYALNQTYGKYGTEYTKIKVTIKEQLIDPAKAPELSDLPEIDPLAFDEARYISMLPEMLHYDFDVNKGGMSYVFTDLTWDLSQTNFSYDSVTANIKLTYSYPGVLPATIDVPVKVKNRTVTNIRTEVPGSYNEIGIIKDSEMIGQIETAFYRVTFDPFENQDPKASLTPLTRLNVQTAAEDAYISWRIEKKDLSGLDAYDPRSYVQGPYYVYFWLADDFGKTQKIEVRVIINSKEIVSTDLVDQEFVPYGYMDYGDGELGPNRLSLPDTVRVNYADGTHQYIDIPSGGWNIPEMSYTFEENGGVVDKKQYRVTTMLGIGESSQEVGFTVTVHRRELKSIASLELDSVDDITLPSRRMATFFDGISDIEMEVDIHWAISQAEISSSFAGATYYSDVTIADPLFGSQTLRNLRITVSQTAINSLILPSDVLPANKDIIPFIATQRIDQLLAKSGFKLAIEGTHYTILEEDMFDIISWRYVDAGGINLDGSESYIIVKIGNKGYSPNNKIWTQEVFVDLSDYVLDVSSASINNILEIDPYDYTLPTKLNITLSGGQVVTDIPCTYNLSSIIDTLFKIQSAVITNGITVGSGNNRLRFSLDVINTNPRAKISIDYGIDFENTEIKAFDTTFRLPLTALVTFDTGEILSLPVEWLSVDSFTEQGGILNARSKVGSSSFGYILDDLITINIAPELVLSTSIPETITIDPYGASVSAQLLAQGLDINNISVVTTEAGEDAPRIMSAPMPNINVTYEGNGEGQVINFMIGVDWHLGKRVQKAIPVNVIVEERRAVGVVEKFEGTVYEHADLDVYDSLSVLFQNGMVQQLPIKGWDISNLRYTLIGGRYTVKAFIGEGAMAQSVDVEIIVKPSKLLEIGKLVDGQYQAINGLTVDPYEGFVGLPETVLAKFQHAEDRPREIRVDWAYSHIARVMSVNGDGDGLHSYYDGNMAAVATVYMLEGSSKVALQSIEVPVTVLNKETQTIYVSKSENGDDFVEYSNQVSIDPYAGPYSESFASPDFAYYRRVKLALRDGTEKVFSLDASSYHIFDNDTKVATNLNNLYTGRNIIVNMTFGRTGGSVARDALVTRIINATILDMTYAQGLPKDEYFIDVYGIRPELDTEVQFTQNIEVTIKGQGSEEIEHNFVVTYDDSAVNTQFKADLPVRIGQAIGFNEGEGRLYATYGNEFGGYQRVIIPVVYLNRVAERLFDELDTPYFGTFVSGESSASGFIIDPFEFGKDTFISAFPTQGEAQFTDIDGTHTKVLNINWDNEKAKKLFSIKGGITQVYATIGSGANAQRIEFQCKVLNRRVVSSVENEGIQNVIKPAAYQSGGALASGKIKPYNYLEYTDVASKINSDLFASGTVFTVNTVEGEPIQYTYNAYATNQGKLILGSGEQNIRMLMQMDTGMALSHRGGYLRFYLAMPGYASGEEGQQQVPLYVPMQEQYIKEVTVDNGTTQGQKIADYLLEYETGGALERINTGEADITRWRINNPYYFIMREGGLTLPSDVFVKTGTKDGGIDDKYSMEVRWSNASKNQLTISYDDELIQTAFSIDLDGQSFGLTFECEPYVLSNTLLFSSMYSYFGVDEFIDLPTNLDRHDRAYNIIGVEGNGNYVITFDNGMPVEFTGIGGSGNRFTSNRWDFGDVWFDSEAPVQEATLRLGGIGGQTIRWEMTTSSKYTVNYSVQTLYVAERSQGFYLPDPLNHNRMPETITQYFSDATYKNFRVSYTEITDEDEDQYAASFNASTRIVTPSLKSPANPNEETSGGIFDFIKDGITDYGTVTTIRWEPTANRAYPSDDLEMGEDIFFSVYENLGDSNLNQQRTTYLRHPDDPDYGYVVAPGLGFDYKYVEGIYVLDGYKSESRFSGSGTLNQVPVLYVRQGVRFDFRNLPVYEVYNRFTTGGFLGMAETVHTQDFTFYMPWTNGSVRYLAPGQADSWSFTGDEDNFGINWKAEEINTSLLGAVYTISTEISLGGVAYRMHTKVVVVEDID